MSRTIDPAEAAAVLASIADTFNIAPGTLFAVTEEDSAAFEVLIEAECPIVASSNGGLYICGPLDADQAFVIQSLANLGSNCAVITPEVSEEYLAVQVPETEVSGTVNVYRAEPDGGPSLFDRIFHAAELMEAADAVEVVGPNAARINEDAIQDFSDCPERSAILFDAELVVTEGRNELYGEPEDNLARVAAMWTAYLGFEIAPSDVALMMGLLKIARAANGQFSRDTFVDLAGYAAIGGEVAQQGGFLDA